MKSRFKSIIIIIILTIIMRLWKICLYLLIKVFNMKNGIVSIILPTYKEAENIPVICEKIDFTMKRSNIDYEIIIVDDNSADGTFENVEKIKDTINVALKIRKNERGLASAVIEGFRLVKGEYIVVMDADLSHPADKIPDMIKLITSNEADFVVGSRFVEGGSAEYFNLFRKFNAWVSKMIARPFTKVNDPMAGFFAFSRSLLVNIEELNPLGFKIGLEVIVKTNPQNIVEIPIQFQERLYGESKLSLREQINYLIHIKRLFEYKYKSFSELIKFSLVGFSGMFVNLFVLHVAKKYIKLDFEIALVVGFLFALTTNFLLNRKFTFIDKSERHIFKQYVEFFVFAGFAFIINWFFSVYLYNNYIYFSKNYMLAALLGIILGMSVNFIGSKFVVFREKK